MDDTESGKLHYDIYWYNFLMYICILKQINLEFFVSGTKFLGRDLIFVRPMMDGSMEKIYRLIKYLKIFSPDTLVCKTDIKIF